jgi:hypothetical protein
MTKNSEAASEVEVMQSIQVFSAPLIAMLEKIRGLKTEHSRFRAADLPLISFIVWALPSPNTPILPQTHFLRKMVVLLKPS